MINTFRAERFIFTVTANGQASKVFDVMFGADGSIYVNFPYFENSTGIASIVTLPAGTRYPADISYLDEGKVTSHLVKYSHHPDGRTHFSQTRKVKNIVGKQSTSLFQGHGHFFTITAQGLSGFDKVNPQKDNVPPTPSRTLLNFPRLESQPEAYKFLCMRYLENDWQKRIVGEVKGPWISTINPEGHVTSGFLISPPDEVPTSAFVLYVSYEGIPLVVKTGEPSLSFAGGFDHPKKINDLQKDTQFLFLSYPADDYEELRSRIGTVDIETT